MGLILKLYSRYSYICRSLARSGMRLNSLTTAARATKAWNPSNHFTRVQLAGGFYHSRFDNSQVFARQARHHISHLHTAASKSQQPLYNSQSFMESSVMAPEAPDVEKEENARPSSLGKRPAHQNKSGPGKKRQQKKTRKRERDMKGGSSDEVLAIDIRDLRASLNENENENENEPEGNGEVPVAEESLPEPGSEIIVKVVELSSTGDALALQEGSKQIYVVPFAVPGDVVKVKVYRHLQEEQYTVADFISVVSPGPSRDDRLVRCGYFAKCSGCQFQMLGYGEQLRLKKRIVEKAFRNFADLPPELLPPVQDTIGSPLRYGYRTKLTPHFDAPPGGGGPRRKKTTLPFATRPDTGFMLKGKRTTLDIEDCPIGTEAVRLGMKKERARMDVEFGKYTRGATILLRESTTRVPKDAGGEVKRPPNTLVVVETDTHTDFKTCITDSNVLSFEYVGDYVFRNPAGAFFQNNNSILPVFTDYVRSHILPTPSSSSSSSASKPIKYLIDAYSGSGLFTITLSSLFEGSTGIDIAEKSIYYARQNAQDNNLPPDQAKFIAADAGRLFESVQYDPDETVVVLDPPRKGCDAEFLAQLLRFAPRRVVYVSCNVHTQARDVGMLVRGETDGDGEQEGGEEVLVNEKGTRYAVESIRGFDFFPQTGHVEGVAVLNRIDAEPGGDDGAAVPEGASVTE